MTMAMKFPRIFSTTYVPRMVWRKLSVLLYTVGATTYTWWKIRINDLIMQMCARLSKYTHQHHQPLYVNFLTVITKLDVGDCGLGV